MRLRDQLTGIAALAAIAVAIFAVGGVLRWSQALVAVLAGLALCGTALSHREPARLSPLVALLGIATGLTILQLLPLGPIVDGISPMVAALRSDGSELLGIAPWNALTADAPATLTALVSLLALLGLALVTLRIATSERGRYRIVAAVAALCGLAAVVTGIHEILGLRALYGLYEPIYAQPILLGPLLNTNTLAGLTAVGATLGIGLAAHRRQPGWLRALWLVQIIACGAVTAGTVSRGATLALLGGALVTIALLLAQRFAPQDGSRRSRARLVSTALPMSVLAGCLVVLVIYSNAGNVERQLSQLSFDELHYSRSKFAAWRSATQLVEESPWIGVGRGAFEPTFTRVHEPSGLATYAYLENEYLQAAVDWGIPGTLLLALALLWFAFIAGRRWRDSAITAGALGALVVVGIQSNVDFGLQFLGLAAPVTAIAATVAYVPLREARRPLLAPALRIIHAVALLVGAGLLLTSITTPLDEDRRVIARTASLDRVRESVARHPLDYYGYAVAADLSSRRGDPQAIRLLNHAMALHPTHPHLHRMAARMLHTQGFVAQAEVEYAAALRMTISPKPLLAEIVGKFSAEQAASALPLDHAHPAVLVRTLQELGRGDIARRWLARVLRVHPHASQVCALLYKIAEGGDTEAAEIAGRRCADRLPDYQTRLSLARMLATKGNHVEAILLLEDVESWQSRRDDKIDAWLALCDAHLALRYIDETKRCLRRLDASPDMLEERRGEIIKRLDAIHDQRSPTGSAAVP